MNVPLTLLSSGAAFHCSRSWEYFGMFFIVLKSAPNLVKTWNSGTTHSVLLLLSKLFFVFYYIERDEKNYFWVKIFLRYIDVSEEPYASRYPT